MKSHFNFSRSQQSGIFLLLLLIVVLQGIYFFVDYPSEELAFNSSELERFQKEVDSLRSLEIENNKPKLFPFNPNYITDYKGYSLGMSVEEIDRLHAYRATNKWVNSSKEFQKITEVSDTLLERISPYFKFPDWATNPNPKNFGNKFNSGNKVLTNAQKKDLNTATSKQLQRVNGIGEKLSERIVKFRNKFAGGFIADIQLKDVYGLTPEVIERITNEFTVKTPRQIQKINLNSGTLEELVTIQHIDYDLAYKIIDQRTLREGFKSYEDLLKIEGFPQDKIEIIKLYLLLE